MNHSFSVEVAIQYGIPCALVLGHIDYIVQRAKTNGEKRRDGKNWVRKSVSDFVELYPYLSRDQIRRALEKLRKEGLIQATRFKSNECTRTLWYTTTKAGTKLLTADRNAASVPQQNGTSATSERQESRTNAAQEPDRAASVPQQNGTSAIPTIEDCSSSCSSFVDSCNRGGGGKENPSLEITDHHRQESDTIEHYASSNLRYLSPRNMEELQSFSEDMPEELIRYAIDEACASGHPVYGYVRSILNRYLDQGFKSVGEVKAYEQDRTKKGGRNSGEHRSSSSAAPRRIAGETIV